MSIECGVCERDLRGGHAPDCQRGKTGPELGPDEFIGKAQINGHWYSDRHMIRVAQITRDGSTCTVPLSALIDTMGEDETYQVRVTAMRKAEFDRLEEFSGW